MRRTASEILRDLEIRVARLESNRFSKRANEGMKLLDRIEQMVRDNKPGTRSWDDVIEKMEDFLDDHYEGNRGISNQFQLFKMESGSSRSLQALSEFREKFEGLQGKSKKSARLERVADTSLSFEVHRKIKEELKKYTGVHFGSFATTSVIQRETSKRSNSDFVWVKVEEGDDFAYVIFELLPLGLAMNFMFYDLVDYKMAKKDFSKFVRQGKI